MKNILLKIMHEWRAFRQAPLLYLYTYTYPDDQKVKIYPYEPAAVTPIINRLRNQVRALFPSLSIYQFGSTALKIAGAKDIDLYIVCPYWKITNYLPGLISVFGRPVKIRRKFVEWVLAKEDYRVEIVLIDPRQETYKRAVRLHKLFTNNNQLLRRYETLKISLDNTSVREYQKQRLIFFNRLLSP